MSQDVPLTLRDRPGSIPYVWDNTPVLAHTLWSIWMIHGRLPMDQAYGYTWSMVHKYRTKDPSMLLLLLEVTIMRICYF